MTPTLRAEFRKLLTVRSTYIVCGLTLALIGFFSFYGSGVKGGPVFVPGALQLSVLNSISVAGVFVGVLSILLICHEYRYNTIAYSLTIADDRMKVLGSKMVVTAALAIVMTLLTIVLTIGLTTWGAAVGGHAMHGQHIETYSMLWKTIAFVLGSAWLGLAIGFLVRSVVGAITFYFVLPAIESLLHNVLKVSNNYLPTASQNQILQLTPLPDAFSSLASLGMFSLYLAGALVAASALFIRRDALS